MEKLEALDHSYNPAKRNDISPIRMLIIKTPISEITVKIILFFESITLVLSPIRDILQIAKYARITIAPPFQSKTSRPKYLGLPKIDIQFINKDIKPRIDIKSNNFLDLIILNFFMSIIQLIIETSSNQYFYQKHNL